MSSPGDVAHERRIAREIFERLNAEFAGRIVLEPYFWEYEPFDFSKSFQEQIPSTANFDVVLCLLWSRLGSRLGSTQKLPDGKPANSGTEYEITYALAAQKERHGLPELHVWLNKTRPSFQPEPEAECDARIAQYRALKAFIDKWTKNSADGSFVGSFTDYLTIADFQDKFEVKLRKIAERRAAVSPGTLAPRPKPAWTGGSPFRGLEPFDFKHAPIFFGRTAAVSSAIEALRKTQADTNDPRNFLLVLGASGSGKSSLARAGILPVLTEPGVIDGVGLWRRAVMKPSDAGGDLLLGLATAILAENALPELDSYSITPQSLAANPTRIPEEIRSGLRVASEREQARQQAELDALIRQYQSEDRPDDVAALRVRRDALRPPSTWSVLLVDQFEEIFTPGLAPEKRDALLGALDVLPATIRSSCCLQCAAIFSRDSPAFPRCGRSRKGRVPISSRRQSRWNLARSSGVPRRPGGSASICIRRASRASTRRCAMRPRAIRRCCRCWSLRSMNFTRGSAPAATVCCGRTTLLSTESRA